MSADPSLRVDRLLPDAAQGRRLGAAARSTSSVQGRPHAIRRWLRYLREDLSYAVLRSRWPRTSPRDARATASVSSLSSSISLRPVSWSTSFSSPASSRTLPSPPSRARRPGQRGQADAQQLTANGYATVPQRSQPCLHTQGPVWFRFGDRRGRITLPHCCVLGVHWASLPQAHHRHMKSPATPCFDGASYSNGESGGRLDGLVEVIAQLVGRDDEEDLELLAIPFVYSPVPDLDSV